MFAIELVGLPGVGKSTIAKPLAQRLSARLGRPVMTADTAFLDASRKRGDGVYRAVLRMSPDFVARRIVGVFSKRTLFRFDGLVEFLTKHHALLAHTCAGRAFQTMSQHDRHIVVSGLLSGGSFYQSIQSAGDLDRIVIFDEGFIQLSLIMSSPAELNFDADAAVGFIDHAPMPNLVVHLTSQIDTCVGRMRGRPKGVTRRMRRLDERSLRESLRLTEGAISTVVRFVPSRGCPVVQVESAGTIAETIDAVADAVCPVLAAASRQATGDSRCRVR